MPMLNIPEFSKYPEVKGVFVQGCVDRGEGSSFRRKAHAHTSKCKNPGWICVRSLKRIRNESTGKLSNLMLHELAHILTDSGHTLKWGKKLKKLGGRIERNYAWRSKL